MPKPSVDDLIAQLPPEDQKEIRTRSAKINEARAEARQREAGFGTLDESIGKESPAVQARIITNGDKLAKRRDKQ